MECSGKVADHIVQSDHFDTEWPELDSKVVFEYLKNSDQINIGRRKIDSPFGSYWQVTTWELAKNHFGHGRSESLEQSTLKAFSELIERKAMADFFKQSLWPESYQVQLKGGNLSYQGKAPPEMIPNGLHNSNGWAVHTSPKRAIKSAVREALERHLLLINFLADGWNGFAEGQQSIDDYKVRSLIGKRSHAGYACGMSVVKSQKLPGASFGQICDFSAEIGQSHEWKRSYFEAHTLLKILEDKSSKNEEVAGDEFVRLSHEFMTNNFELNELDPFENQLEELSKTIDFNLYVFNLKPYLQLPFEMYASYAFGRDLVPLYLCSRLNSNSKKFVQSKLHKYQIANDLTEQHPIL